MSYHKLIILGSGFGGLAAAIRLSQSGENDFIVLEQASDVGGVWRDNIYPGCVCDVPSHLYSFSFFPNSNWSNHFPAREEIHDYIKNCVSKFNLFSHIKFNHKMLQMNWDEAQAQWVIKTNQGVFKSQFVIGAFGSLSVPKIPQLPGVNNFQGESFHSSAWPKKYSAKNLNVAVIGTGASAIQIIPQLQNVAKNVIVFQRTPPWILPRPEGKISERLKDCFKRFPLLQKALRLKIFLALELNVFGFLNPYLMSRAQLKALDHLNSSIEDPGLAKQLTPNYSIGCKRILLSNDYYPSFNNPNQKLINSTVSEVGKSTLLDNMGNRHDVDTIIYATGFKIVDNPTSDVIFGKNKASLSQFWSGTPHAYLGTTIANFPNLFILQGPNSGLGHSSIIFMLESQVEHILKLIHFVAQKPAQIIEVKAEVQHNFNQSIRLKMKKSIWLQGGCSSWYLDANGNNVSLWPGSSLSFRKATQNASMDSYDFRSITK